MEKEKDKKVLQYLIDARKIFNIGIIAHIDAGKTTLTERLLFFAKAIHKIVDVHKARIGGESTTTDTMSQEIEKGITISSACVTIYWSGEEGNKEKRQINIIDTPGHVDFTAEVERSLRVLDGAIVVLDGQAGVEPQTETVWRQANRHKVPRLIFINKMDKVGANFIFSLNSLKKIGADLLVCQLPIGAEKQLEGIIDLVTKKAYYIKQLGSDDNYEEREIPHSYLKQVNDYRQTLIEKCLEYDEKLGEKYLIGQELTNEEIKLLVRKATLSGKLFPVFCGSAFKNFGVKKLLDAVIDYLPSALDSNSFSAFSIKDQREEKLSINYEKTLALAFKIVIDKFNNKFTFFRVYSGSIISNSYFLNVGRGKTERVSRLLRINSNEFEEVKRVSAGDIAAAIGLEYTVTGDTLGSEGSLFTLENIKFAESVISLALEPRTKKDNDKLRESLDKLRIQDPSFNFYTNKETSQIIITGMGELHLEILISRLEREFGVNVKTGKPKVAYRETIKNNFDSEGIYKHQSGGHGQFGVVNIRFEPNQGKGFEFINAIREGAIPKEYIPSVKEGLIEIFSCGPLLGYPVVDVKATLYDGKFHEVDSSNLAFKNAAILAFKNNQDKLGMQLLEPIMKVVVSVPDEYYGVALASLTSQRGTIVEVEKNENEQRIQAKVPLSNILGYTTTLRSLTAGKGVFNMELSHYQKAPIEVLNEIIKREKDLK